MGKGYLCKGGQNMGETWFQDLISNISLVSVDRMLQVGLVILIAVVVNRVGILIIGRVFKDREEGALQGEVAKSLVGAARTFLNYGLIFVILIAVLEIFQVHVVGPEELRQVGLALLKALGIVLLAKVVLRLNKVFVNYLLLNDKQKTFLNEARRMTLSGLIKSLMVYVVYFIAATMLLENFGVKTGSILAGVGVLGLALSFGAQNLVRDVIAGFFIIFEDQYNVGEVVHIVDVTGVVQELGLRTTQLKEWTGQLHTIPNGEIRKVANFSRGDMVAVILLGIAYEEDIDKAFEVLRQEGLRAKEEIETITEEPIVHGVTELGDSHVGIRVVVKTRPGEQWGVEREMRKRYKQALDAAGIEIPYPRRVVIDGNKGKED
jgi:moderate conductance mechanosensitive channel